MENRQVRWMKVVLLASSLLSLVVLGWVAYEENFRGEWRSLQRRYRKLLIDSAADDNARRVADAFQVQYKQVYLPELSRIDRCTTCHLGVENPAMEGVDAPLGRHSRDLVTLHPPEKFGCTVCHEGAGRAVRKDEAHGLLADGRPRPHVDRPLRRGAAVYTSCSKCHEELDLFGAPQDLYAGGESAGAVMPIDQVRLEASLPGADALASGRDLVIESGCLGCHKYRGRGGTLGPDITYVGDKTAHDFDFRHVRGEHTVEQWLFEHFMLPSDVSPGTSMPELGFTAPQARQLALYMLALRRKSGPSTHRPLFEHGRVGAPEPVRGETLYRMFCSACHGIDGFGTTARTVLWSPQEDPWRREWEARNVVREEREGTQVVVPSLSSPDTLAVASPGYFHRIIKDGRPGTKMIAWADEGGLDDDEITLLVDYIFGWRPPLTDLTQISSERGVPRVGGALYRANCSPCHGRDGEGAIAVALNSPTFLAVVSDDFLRDTIVHGRPDTAMPAWRQFDARDLSDILAFIRQWQPSRATVDGAKKLLAAGTSSEVSVDIGRILYKANCVVCHGGSGQGDLAPSLNTQEFLSVVSDTYLLGTLVRGRPGTAMPSWRHLADADLASIVLFLRTWQSEPSADDAWHAEHVARGEEDNGRTLFVQICSGCHGTNAEGATGPQLGNPVFLSMATDRMLEHWIANGKQGTEMRPFRKGGQGVAELSDRQIVDIVSYLRSLERPTGEVVRRIAKSPHGRPEKGAVHYRLSCAGCHGERGEGASGPALSNQNFLRFASDGYLLATLALGRTGTEMRPVKKSPQSILELSSDEVNDVVAFLRSWESSPPFGAPETTEIPHRFVVPSDLRRGRDLFRSNCAGCHGLEGKGSWAPELNNEGFLAAATDGYIQATIVRGRVGTAMRGFGQGSQGLSNLDADAVDDIVAFIRSWSRSTPAPLTAPALSPGESRPQSAVHGTAALSQEKDSRRVALGDRLHTEKENES